MFCLLSYLLSKTNSRMRKKKIIISKEELKIIDSVVMQLSEWTDIEKHKGFKEEYFKFNIWYLEQKQQIGEIITKINKSLNDNISKEMLEMKIEYFKKYWKNEYDYLIQQMILEKYEKFPSQYRLF